MRLTWDEFLKLASALQKFGLSIALFHSEEIDIKEKNRRVAAAAKDYEEFLNDLKYMQFMNAVRISLIEIY